MTNSARHNSCVIFRRSLSVAGIVFAIVVSGCSEPQNSTAPSAADLTLRFGKPVKLLSSQANMVWEDSVNVAAPGAPASWAADGIRGDGRNKTGQPSTFSKYPGDYCGVSAYLGTDGTSSMNVDTDFGYTSSMTAACGSPAQLYRFYYDGAATHVLVRGTPHGDGSCADCCRSNRVEGGLVWRSADELRASLVRRPILTIQQRAGDSIAQHHWREWDRAAVASADAG